MEQRIFDGLKKMIAVCKRTPAFADYHIRKLRNTGNPHLFVFMRNNPLLHGDYVPVTCNFDSEAQSCSMMTNW